MKWMPINENGMIVQFKFSQFSLVIDDCFLFKLLLLLLFIWIFHYEIEMRMKWNCILKFPSALIHQWKHENFYCSIYSNIEQFVMHLLFGYLKCNLEMGQAADWISIGIKWHVYSLISCILIHKRFNETIHDMLWEPMGTPFNGRS